MMDGTLHDPTVPVHAGLLRSAKETVQLDWSRLAAHLAENGLMLDESWAPRQFVGGYGNLNYLIRAGGLWAVLRRPPFGPVPKGANDMAREHRVLSTLSPAWPLAPRALHFAEDAQVIGAPFLISEFRAGLPLHGVRPLGPDMTEAQARTLSELQCDILVALHRLDIERIGATRLGRMEDFAARSLRGWAARLEGGVVPSPPAAAKLFSWLRGSTPRDGRRAVIHNDFKLDNVVVDPETLAPRAVLDWDMATLGAPLFDLATLLTYWAANDDPAPLRAINLTHSMAPGALSRRALVERYFAAAGFDHPADEDDMRFFLALAFAKLGVVCMQLFGRFLEDPETNARNEKFGAAIPGAFELGLAAAGGELL
ncbi:MAG: phosphotransferase family protein [Kiloniellales bacterium]